MQFLSGQLSLDLFGITIMEPTVMLTNFIITAVCSFAFIHLKNASTHQKVIRYFRSFFIFMALATFLSGVFGHAFQYIVGPQWKLLGWFSGLVSIFLMSHASILHASSTINTKYITAFKLVNFLALIIFTALTVRTLDFNFVQFHSVFAFLLLVLPIHIVVFIQTRNVGSKLMIYTICFTSLSAFIFTFKISLGIWFNHLDIAHTILALSMYFFYRAALKLGESFSSQIDF